MVSTETEGIDERVLKLINDILYGDIKGTYNIVVATILVLKEIINNTEWTTAKYLSHFFHIHVYI